jgi:hypothetical protein
MVMTLDVKLERWVMPLVEQMALKQVVEMVGYSVE